MRVDFARADVGELCLRVFARSVHPELMATHARALVEQKDFTAQLWITSSGHVATFNHGGKIVCEVATTANQPLPQKQQVISRRMRGSRNESVEHDGGILYHVSFQVEKLEPEVYLHLQEEWLADARQAKVACEFAPSSRMSPCPLSFIAIEETPKTLLLHAVHTFPDILTVVKTQSLFEV